MQFPWLLTVYGDTKVTDTLNEFAHLYKLRMPF